MLWKFVCRNGIWICNPLDEDIIFLFLPDCRGASLLKIGVFFTAGFLKPEREPLTYTGGSLSIINRIDLLLMIENNFTVF